MSNLQQAISWLTAFANGETVHIDEDFRGIGLCSLMNRDFGLDVYMDMNKDRGNRRLIFWLKENYPGYSGNPSFPIRCPEELVESASRAYYTSMKETNVTDRVPIDTLATFVYMNDAFPQYGDGPYARARREYAGYLAQALAIPNILDEGNYPEED